MLFPWAVGWVRINCGLFLLSDIQALSSISFFKILLQLCFFLLFGVLWVSLAKGKTEAWDHNCWNSRCVPPLPGCVRLGTHRDTDRHTFCNLGLKPCVTTTGTCIPHLIKFTRQFVFSGRVYMAVWWETDWEIVRNHVVVIYYILNKICLGIRR